MTKPSYEDRAATGDGLSAHWLPSHCTKRDYNTLVHSDVWRTVLLSHQLKVTLITFKFRFILAYNV